MTTTVKGTQVRPKRQKLHIQDLWDIAEFSPDPSQREAILHTDGPLFLTAGPGSGKTRVLLWRTVNLIVCHQVPPEEIFLGTFTEKAALQLRQGLMAYLSEATRHTGEPYDLARMLIGTVHSICRRILGDRRFSPGGVRPAAMNLGDELDQYFFVLSHWDQLTTQGGFEDGANISINQFFTGRRSTSRHGAVAETISLFNRFSEECLDPDPLIAKVEDPVLQSLLRMYSAYLALGHVDLSLLQRKAIDHLGRSKHSGSVFRHVIVDEYQDTNAVQERLFFHLAKGHRNLCVVGDDDQALYRFRGSTVENLVEFEHRCRSALGVAPRTINLGINYRSDPSIVQFSRRYIDQIDWRKGGGRKGAYRVEGKQAIPDRPASGPKVVASAPDSPEDVCREVAGLVRRLIAAKKVEDPNQVAFLYPSLKSTQVGKMITALRAEGLEVFAPRAGQFLQVPEAQDVFGVFQVLFPRPSPRAQSLGLAAFQAWLNATYDHGRALVRGDRELARFVKSKQEEIDRVTGDRKRLVQAIGIPNLKESFTQAAAAQLSAVHGVSERTHRSVLQSAARMDGYRGPDELPKSIEAVISRATTLDWGVLDLFYMLMGQQPFRKAFDLAQNQGDEGPLANLSLVSQYLGRYQGLRGPLLSARDFELDRFFNGFFASFLYALWRRGESEFENAEDPFPRGRIPFLTVHQAKGLEFPVVVLGNPRKRASVQKVEEVVRPLLDRPEGEPLDRIGIFDAARMFYVALSRPQNLLVLCHYRGQGQSLSEPFRSLLDAKFPRIAGLRLDSLAAASSKAKDDLPKSYSYTGDYLAYRACPRRYMLYRHLNFTPSRAQTMFFGSLVHRTIEDLHEWLHAQIAAGRRLS